MVETALTLPIFLLLLFMTIDFGRAVYTWVMLGQDAQFAARQISLPDNQASDCSAINGVQSSGNGVSVKPDPNSYIWTGNTDPSSSPSPLTTATAPNSGYLYLYPAQASASPPTTSNCNNTNSSSASSPARNSGTVTAVVTYNFVPWTPIASQMFPTITLKAQATLGTQY